MATLDFDQAEFLFHSDGLADATLRVFRFSGRESLSHPFEFIVELVSDERALDLQAPIGRPARLTLLGRRFDGGRYRRYVHGIVERFVQLSAHIRHSRYQATVVPTIKPLHYSRNSRIFQNQSAPAVTQKVLKEAMISSDRIRAFLQSSYEPRDYCVQYQESDLSFIQRLWEEEGIFYFFEQEPDKDILNLGDGVRAFDSLPHYSEVHLRDQPHLYEEGLMEFRAECVMHPGAIVLRDFRFKQPMLDMEVAAQDERFADHKLYHFPGEYVDPALGQRLAKVRLQEQQCQGSRYVGAGNVRAMLPGYRFTLTGHLRKDCNQEYVIVGVEHEGVQARALGADGASDEQAVYRNRLECIPAAVVYRPPRRTQVPRIPGVQTAVIVGPPGEEIHCDSHGRVKVQFHWDREGRQDDHSSCWIRVSQPWGGGAYGGLFLPRVGQEVLVLFLEGDPDRPVIAGRVYNGENPLPYNLPEHKTVSTLKTASSPGGDGFNELRFEDAAGAEEIFLHGQLDMNTVIERDRSQRFGRDTVDNVGRNRTRDVTNNETIHIGADRSAMVDGNETLLVGKDHSLDIRGNQDVKISASQNVTISADQSINVAADQHSCVGGHAHRQIAKSRTTRIEHDDALTIEGSRVVSVGGGQSKKVKGGYKLLISNGPCSLNIKKGKQTIEVDGPISISSGSEIKLSCGAGSITIERSGNIIIKGPLVKINC